MTNLMHANREWANRPDDERYGSLEEMYRATRAYAANAAEAVCPWGDLSAEAFEDDIYVVGRADNPAKLTHYSFGQVARRVGAPAGYLRKLPAPLATELLNHGFANQDPDDSRADAMLLFAQNGEMKLRAATSTRYERVWNYEVIERLAHFSYRHGLVPAQATFQRSQGQRPGHEGALDTTQPKALYASDHDMFAFMMSPERTVTDPTGETLRRGVIVGNSEVGERSLLFMGFLFRDVCQNHIIWGAKNIAEVRIRHIGEARERMGEALVACREFLDASGNRMEDRMQSLTFKIGDTKEDVLNAIFGKRVVGIPRKTLDAAYDSVIPEIDGDPNTVWGMVNGLTRLSQTLPYADARQDADVAASRLMQVAF